MNAILTVPSRSRRAKCFGLVFVLLISFDALAVAQESELRESEKIVAVLLQTLVSQSNFDAESIGELAESETVAKALVNLYAETAIKVDDSNAVCFDASQGFDSVHVAMEPFGKMNTARLHTDAAKRQITNVVVENKTHQNVMENVQNCLGQHCAGPVLTEKHPDLEFSFVRASSSSAGPGRLEKAKFVCQIKPRQK